MSTRSERRSAGWGKGSTMCHVDVDEVREDEDGVERCVDEMGDDVDEMGDDVDEMGR